MLLIERSIRRKKKKKGRDVVTHVAPSGLIYYIRLPKYSLQAEEQTMTEYYPRCKIEDPKMRMRSEGTGASPII